jgi:hypothetical protein
VFARELTLRDTDKGKSGVQTIGFSQGFGNYREMDFPIDGRVLPVCMVLL